MKSKLRQLPELYSLFNKMNLQDLRYILLDLDLSGFRYLPELRHATPRRSLLITNYRSLTAAVQCASQEFSLKGGSNVIGRHSLIMIRASRIRKHMIG